MSPAPKEIQQQSTSSAVTVVPRMPIATMVDASTLATNFAQAHVMGAQNPAEGMLAVVLIHEVGLVKAEATYHIMMGRLTKKAEAILADFIKAGGRYQILQRDAQGARIKVTFGETKDAEFSFTWEDALLEPFVYAGNQEKQHAALKKPIAERILKDKYATPRSRMQMLWARLVSDMGRALCPAATEGLYPPEEVADFDDIQRANSGKVIDVEEVKLRASGLAAIPVAEAPEIGDCTTCPKLESEYDGVAWECIDTTILLGALESDLPQLRPGHKAAIRLVLDQRKAAKQ